MPQIVSRIVDVYPFRRTGSGPEFLLLHRAPGRVLGDTWQAVHGKIEPGETAVQAALRELREETSLAPLAFWQIDAINAFYVARSDEIMLCPCFAAEVGSSSAVVLSDEHVAHRWLPAAEAVAALMWPGQRRAVREIVEEIITPGTAEPHLRVPL